MIPSRIKDTTLIRMVKRPKGFIGITLVLSLTLASLLAPFIAPHDPLKQNLRWRNSPPGSGPTPDGRYFLLGTDQLGRDMLSRILYGLRVSILVALAAVFISGIVGSLLGIVSGFLGGVVDAAIMRLVDIQLSLPLFLIAMVWIAFTSPSLANIVAVIALWTWTQYARVARASTLSIRNMDFVEAARAIGAPTLWILFKHIRPNVTAPVIVIASIQFGRAIILEATLSFLGVGLQPPTPALGVMIASGRQYIDTAWWQATMPGIAIVLLAVGANFLGDTLRDVWDPRLR